MSNKAPSVVGALVSLSVLLFFAFIFWFVFLKEREPSDSSLDSRARVQAQSSVRGLLSDGSSAEFRNLRVLKSESGGLYVCGEVNAKNSFGGYAGHQRFVSIAQMTFLEEQVNDFEEVWQEFCR